MTTTTERPAESLDSFVAKPATKQRREKKRTSKRRRAHKRIPGLYYRVDMSPEELFKALGKLRRKAGDEIERLIALLDRIDPDPDLEPSFGFLPPGVHDEAEPDADGEPSLGSGAISENSSQSHTWSQPGATTDDCEGDEHDGAEPDEYGEPSLGSWDRIENQDHSWAHDGRLGTDCEDDPADNCENDPAEAGIGDLDGLAEQTGIGGLVQ